MSKKILGFVIGLTVGLTAGLAAGPAITKAKEIAKETKGLDKLRFDLAEDLYDGVPVGAC